jgi:hypothetical protein
VRLRGLTTAVAALALLASAPALAQASTSDSDLRCAAWAAFVVGSNPEPEVQSAFSIAMVWFLGRYEAATGIRFEDSLTADYVLEFEPKLQAAQTECLPRMQEMGRRLEDLGGKLTAQEAATSAP